MYTNPFQQIIILTKRDLKISYRNLYDITSSLVFFLCAACMFVFAVGYDPIITTKINGAMIWVLALFSCMLSIENLILSDREDGTLEWLKNESMPGWAYSLSKAFAHWGVHVLPICLLAPLIILMLNGTIKQALMLTLSLFIGMASVSLQSSMIAVLTLNAKRSNLLLLLLLLPFTIPVLIFGSTLINNDISPTQIQTHFALLGACFFFSLFACPLLADLGFKQRQS
ncbi:MAG: heme exporter protein CcmB [Pseudomonadota bacterium]